MLHQLLELKKKKKALTYQMQNLLHMTMGNLHYRPNFNPGKINKIFHHSSKEHVEISRIAKFGCEML